MINGVKYWVGQIPFFLLLVPFLWFQLYKASKEYYYKRFHSHHGGEHRYNPIPIKPLVFICLNCSCTLRIIFTFYIWHLDIDDPGANLNAYTIYIFNVYFIILEWWFIVFFWISMLFGFVSSKSLFDPNILKKVEATLWVIVSIVTLFHAVLIFFNSYGHDIINTDEWWRLGYLIIVYIGIVCFGIYSIKLLKAYRSIKYDKIIYNKLLWFVLMLLFFGFPTATLSPFYYYFGKGNHPTQDVMNMVFSVLEWGHYPFVIILLGEGVIVLKLATILRMPRLQKPKSSSMDTTGTDVTNTGTSIGMSKVNSQSIPNSESLSIIVVDQENIDKNIITTPQNTDPEIIDDNTDTKTY